MRLVLVGARQGRDRFLRGAPFAEEREAVGPVTRICIRLCRDRAHARFRPWNDGADREELRLHGYPPLTRVEIARDDRVGRDDVTAGHT